MKKKYAIRCGSRTGSTLLCELLRSTNRCGQPQEYANPELVSDYVREVGLDQSAGIAEYRNKLFNKKSTENEVFGIKVVGTTAQTDIFNEMDIKPTHWIRLHREDKILQAISRFKAWKTNIWHRGTKTKVPLVTYSFNDIDWCLREIEKEEAYFDEFFKDKDHISISYELDLLEEPEQTATACLVHMGISIDELPEFKPVGEIHRDEVSYEMRERYLKDVTRANYKNWRA